MKEVGLGILSGVGLVLIVVFFIDRHLRKLEREWQTS